MDVLCLQSNRQQSLYHEIRHGHMGCLREIPLDLMLAGEHSLAFAYGIEHGQLECVQFLHKLGLPWGLLWGRFGLLWRHFGWKNDSTMELSTLSTLRYAYDHGCPWTYRMCSVLFDGCTGGYPILKGSWSGAGPHSFACVKCQSWHNQGFGSVLYELCSADVASIICKFCNVDCRDVKIK